MFAVFDAPSPLVSMHMVPSYRNEVQKRSIVARRTFKTRVAIEIVQVAIQEILENFVETLVI